MGRDYRWDVSRPRDRHLMPGGPKRILALDGGGIRGLLTCGILRHIEDTLRERIPPGPERDSFVLADYYDFIGGTSTGSIVAAWLALGKPVKDLQDLYMTMGSEIFASPRVLPQIFVSRFDADKLDDQLRTHLGDMTLDTDALKTGLGVTAKRMDSGSAWVITNNPKAKFWERSDENDRPNKDYVLRNVVRASAAAPAYFDHVEVQIEDGAEPGAFMDGAVAGLNNPSVAFWLYTTLAGYGLEWPTGADNLLITSVGTGEFRQRFTSRKLGRMVAVQQAIFSLAGSIQDVGKNQIQIMQALSRPRHPYPTNADVDSLANPWDLERGFAAPYCITPEPLFEFQRYDAVLDSKGLERLGIYEEGEPLGPGKISKLQKMDCAENKNLQRLKRIGERTGDLYVKPEHFPPQFNTPAMAY
ncbi:MAG: patatin-like phospholipase family protein [Pseudomonadota bacterium]